MRSGGGIRMRWAALSALALALLAASPAAADDAPVGFGEAVYTVSVAEVSTGPEGETATEQVDGTVRIACAADGCRVVEEPHHGLLNRMALSAGSTITGSASSSAAASACQEGIGARQLSLSATAAGLSASMSQDSLGWSDCADGREAYSHARDVTWTGTLVSADDCVFSVDGCLASTSPWAGIPGADPVAPSILSALNTPQQTITTLTAPQVTVTALGTIILALLMKYPTTLINKSVDTGATRLAQWWRGRRAVSDDNAEPGDGAEPATPKERTWTKTWWWASIGVLLAAVVSSFVNPNFGFNPGSARVFVSIAVSFLVNVIAGWALVILLMKRFLPDATHEFQFKPASLLVVAASVLLTRLTGFEPGIIFGAIAGLSFGAITGKAGKARSVLIGAAWAFGLAIAAWIVYGFVAQYSGTSMPATLLVETLTSLTIGGIVALPLGLLPVRGMGGHAVWQWNKWVWTACYGIGLLAFFLILMPMPFSWREVGWDLRAWIGAYLLYAGFAVILWLIMTRPWQKPVAADDAEGAPVQEDEDVPQPEVEFE